MIIVYFVKECTFNDSLTYEQFTGLVRGLVLEDAGNENGKFVFSPSFDAESKSSQFLSVHSNNPHLNK